MDRDIPATQGTDVPIECIEVDSVQSLLCGIDATRLPARDAEIAAVPGGIEKRCAHYIRAGGDEHIAPARREIGQPGGFAGTDGDRVYTDEAGRVDRSTARRIAQEDHIGGRGQIDVAR